MDTGMIENQKLRPTQIIGPLGEPLTIDSLPASKTTRWVPRRKAEVVAAVNGGLLTIEEACDRYDLTFEEFASWQRAIDRSGMPGLRVTRVQHYRSAHARERRGCQTDEAPDAALMSRNPEQNHLLPSNNSNSSPRKSSRA